MLRDSTKSAFSPHRAAASLNSCTQASMARTKQVARWSTGGKAPRKVICSKAPRQFMFPPQRQENPADYEPLQAKAPATPAMQSLIDEDTEQRRQFASDNDPRVPLIPLHDGTYAMVYECLVRPLHLFASSFLPLSRPTRSIAEHRTRRRQCPPSSPRRPSGATRSSSASPPSWTASSSRPTGSPSLAGFVPSPPSLPFAETTVHVSS